MSGITAEERKEANHRDAMETARAAIRLRAGRLKEYADKLLRDADQPVITSDDMAGTINEIENLLRNLNFAEMARRCAELALTE